MNAKVPESLLEQTTRADQKPSWKDPKRYLWLLSPALPVIALTAVSAYAVAHAQYAEKCREAERWHAAYAQLKASA